MFESATGKRLSSEENAKCKSRACRWVVAHLTNSVFFFSPNSEKAPRFSKKRALCRAPSSPGRSRARAARLAVSVSQLRYVSSTRFVTMDSSTDEAQVCGSPEHSPSSKVRDSSKRHSHTPHVELRKSIPAGETRKARPRRCPSCSPARRAPRSGSPKRAPKPRLPPNVTGID